MIIRDGLGNTLAYKDFGTYVKIGAIQVLPSNRRNGCGSKLLDRVKALGKEIVLIADAAFDQNTGISQEALDNFYTKNGFKYLGDVLHMYWKP